MHWLTYVAGDERTPFEPNSLLEAIRRDAQARGETADRVVPADPEWGPGLSTPVKRGTRCPRFQLMPRGHMADEDNKQCVHCLAPLEPEGSDG